MKAYKTIKSYYDKYGNTYDYERNGTYYYDFINKLEIGFLKPYIANKIVLEIGCGTGIILEHSIKTAKAAYGIDLSFRMLYGAKNKGLNIANSNAVDLPFPQKIFDVVYSFKVLPHIPEINNVISEIHRVLKDDGVAVLEFYNPYSFKYLTNLILRANKKIYTRFDSFDRIQNYISKSFRITDIFGVRIVTPFAGIHKIPLISFLVRSVEKRLGRTYFKIFSGYYIIVGKKIK
jgi:ubiquinone/menaquinone biosynthesis C-methylase UbiE